MTLIAPPIWTPSRSRFGPWWRRPIREAIAWMADELKYGTGNHLLYGPTGHLVYECGAPPSGSTCPDFCYGSDTPAAYETSISHDVCSILSCSTMLSNSPHTEFSWDLDVNGTWCLVQVVGTPCLFQATFSYNYNWIEAGTEDCANTGTISDGKIYLQIFSSDTAYLTVNPGTDPFTFNPIGPHGVATITDGNCFTTLTFTDLHPSITSCDGASNSRRTLVNFSATAAPSSCT